MLVPLRLRDAAPALSTFLQRAQPRRRQDGAEPEGGQGMQGRSGGRVDMKPQLSSCTFSIALPALLAACPAPCRALQRRGGGEGEKGKRKIKQPCQTHAILPETKRKENVGGRHGEA